MTLMQKHVDENYLEAYYYCKYLNILMLEIAVPVRILLIMVEKSLDILSLNIQGVNEVCSINMAGQFYETVS